MRVRAARRLTFRRAVGAAALLSLWLMASDGSRDESMPSTQTAAAAADTRSAAAAEPWHARGDSAASVVVLQFSDFDCHYCAAFARDIWPRLDEEFVHTGRVQWRFVAGARGGNGRAAARAAECSASAGDAVFWAMHDRLFTHWRAWQGPDGAALLRRYAREAGADENDFLRCYDGGDGEQRVAAVAAFADRLGVRGTPTFFINGVRVYGALPYADMRALLNSALLLEPTHEPASVPARSMSAAARAPAR